jgi:hypothetical protein
MTTPRYPEDDDPLIAAEIERAIEPYRGLVPPRMLLVLRNIARMSLTEDPLGRELLKRVRALNQTAPLKSTEKTLPGAKANRGLVVLKGGPKPGGDR